MKKRKICLPEQYELRREAGEILSQNGNRLLLIEAILILLLHVPLYLILDTAIHAAFGELTATNAALTPLWSAVYAVLVSLLVLFFTLPSLIGLFGLAGKIAYGAQPTLSELFEPFSSVKSYVRTLHLAWGAFWRFGLIVAAVTLTYQVMLYFFAGSFLWGAVCGLMIVAEIAMGLLLCARNFPVAAVVLFSQVPVREARMLSRNVSDHAYRGGVFFVLGFLPWILLGVLTLGVLLLWDVVPRMLIAYFRYLKQIYEMIIQSEEKKRYE